jgi:hypothetical protein
MRRKAIGCSGGVTISRARVTPYGTLWSRLASARQLLGEISVVEFLAQWRGDDAG